MGRRAHSQFTPDEIANIRLRYDGGESRSSIADDYDVPKERIKYLTKTKAQLERVRVLQMRRYNLKKWGTTDKQTILRKRMVARYMALTGRDLVADLVVDQQCPSPHSSLQPPATSTATRKRSFSGSPSRQQNSSLT